MLPKNQRLNLSLEFKEVASGQRVETDNLVIFFKSAAISSPKIGIALTKKNFPSATERNRAKRLTSSAIQALYLKLRSNLKIVIMPKGKILQSDSASLVGEIEGKKGLFDVASNQSN